MTLLGVVRILSKEEIMMEYMEYKAPEVDLIYADTDVLTFSPGQTNNEGLGLGGVPLT